MVLVLGVAAPSGIATLGQAVYTGLPWFTNIGITNLAVVQHPMASKAIYSIQAFFPKRVAVGNHQQLDVVSSQTSSSKSGPSRGT